MSAAAETTNETGVLPGRYGNWRRPGFQLYGAGLVPGAAVFFTLVFAVIMLTMSHYWLMLFALLSLAVELPLLWPSPAGARYLRVGRWASSRVARRRGTNTLLQAGPAGRVPDGSVRLPGLGASTELSEHETALGDRFALISWPKRDLYTTVMQAQPSGTTGRDQSAIDRMVGEYGGLLKLLGEQGDVAGAQAVVETSPDSGLRLRSSVERGVSDKAPEYCQQVKDATLAKVGAGSPQVSGYFSVTFKGRDPETRKSLPKAEVVEDLAARLPYLLGQARVSGAGDTTRWASGQYLIDQVRAAYDPAVAHDIEEARLLGAGTGLEWSDVGPVAADTAYQEYHHEGAISRTWVWVKPPPAPETERILEALLRPHGSIPRKRVAILYRPMSPEASHDLASRGVKETLFGASQKRRVDSDHATKVNVAKRAEEEENEGAVMVRTSVMITITAFSEEELRKATGSLKQLIKRTHLKMRVAKGMQDSAFLATLPVGLVIPEFLAVPDEVRDQV